MTRRLVSPTAPVFPAALVFLAALALALLTGCGVPTEAAPRPLEPPAGPVPATPPTAASAPAGPVVERLCLVRDDKLVRVERRTSSAPSVYEHLEHLLAGPTQAESDVGLTSALTGTNVVAGVELTDGEASVEVGGSLEGPSRSDQVLAYGQIVCTLDSRPDVDGVSFVQRGQPLGIPRENGQLSTGPLTLADYATLISGR